MPRVVKNVRSFWLRKGNSEVVKVYLKEEGMSVAGTTAPEPEPEPAPKPKKKPEIAWIKGWGKDYSDGSTVCFHRNYPNLQMSDNPGRCGKKGKFKSNATWGGFYKFIGDNRLVLMVRNLKSPYPPGNRIAIGYRVRLRNAVFSDGSREKTFEMMSFRRKPKKTHANKEVAIRLN